MSHFKAVLVFALSSGICWESARADVSAPGGVLTQNPQGASDFVQYGDFANGQPQNIYANSGIPLDDLVATTYPSTVNEVPGSISVSLDAGEHGDDPYVSLDATVDGSSLNATVNLTYYMEVVGLYDNSTAPTAEVDVDGNLLIGGPASGTGFSASATAWFTLRDSASNILLNETTAGNYEASTTLNVGQVYSVTLTAGASMFDQSGEFTIQAGSDPTFSLEGPDASSYQIIYSAGVAPEPPAWSLLAVGLVGLGLFDFHRKAKAALL